MKRIKCLTLELIFSHSGFITKVPGILKSIPFIKICPIGKPAMTEENRADSFLCLFYLIFVVFLSSVSLKES